MAILIDGYNLLNVTGIEGLGSGTALAKARRGLVHFLARTLTPEETAATTIVFDAKYAPPGLPRREQICGITLIYAKDYAEADDLIEELIEIDRHPRRLVVVSSDHRLHRAARRRRATAIDSDVWFAEIERRSSRQDAEITMAPKSPPAPEQLAHWLAEFGDVDVSRIQSELQGESPSADVSPLNEAVPPPAPPRKPPLKDGVDQDLIGDAEAFIREFSADIESAADEFDEDSPFPKGYGEDLLDGDAQ